jgi:predicted transcriptional regulator
MTDDIYVKLCERLNQNAVKMPPVESVLALLRELFTREQAGLAAEMPIGAHTVKSLAGQLNRDPVELEKILETMADEGIMFVSKTDNDEKEYSVPPFAPGILELQFLKG